MFFITLSQTAGLKYADMAELADAPDLGSGVERRAGSSPVIRIFYKAWEALVDSPLYGDFAKDFAKGLRQSLCTPWAFWGNMSLGVSDL